MAMNALLEQSSNTHTHTSIEEEDDALAQDDLRLLPTLRPATISASQTLPPPAFEEEVTNEETSVNATPATRWLLADAALPRSVAAHLEAVGGAYRTFAVTTTRTIIGRGESADIRLDDGTVSRKHATILHTGDEFRIRDDGSANGTLLNGSRVLEYALRNGDELLIGDVALRFVIELPAT
jgi:hypothetical protein